MVNFQIIRGILRLFANSFYLLPIVCIWRIGLRGTLIYPCYGGQQASEGTCGGSYGFRLGSKTNYRVSQRFCASSPRFRPTSPRFRPPSPRFRPPKVRDSAPGLVTYLALGVCPLDLPALLPGADENLVSFEQRWVSILFLLAEGWVAYLDY